MVEVRRHLQHVDRQLDVHVALGALAAVGADEAPRGFVTIV